MTWLQNCASKYTELLKEESQGQAGAPTDSKSTVLDTGQAPIVAASAEILNTLIEKLKQARIRDLKQSIEQKENMIRYCNDTVID